jgi:hypothetical protein
MKQHELRDASFDEFVAFLFDQEVVPDPEAAVTETSPRRRFVQLPALR